MALANLIIGPRASACGTCIPRPSPLPQHSLPTHYWAWGVGVGAGWHCPGGGRDSRGPPGTKVPSWLPGWQEVGTAEAGQGGGNSHLVPARGRGAHSARAKLPTRTLLGVGTEPWREEGEHAPLCGPQVTLPPLRALGAGPWELPAWPVPTPLCRPVGSEVIGSHAPQAHLFPRVPSSCSPHLGPSFLRQEEG